MSCGCCVLCLLHTHELNGTLTKAMSCRDCHCFWMVGNWCLCLLFTLREKRVNIFHIFTYITLVHHYLHGGMVVYASAWRKNKRPTFHPADVCNTNGIIIKKSSWMHKAVFVLDWTTMMVLVGGIRHGPSDIYLWRKIKPQASACLWDIYLCIEYISYIAPIFLSFVLSITFLPSNKTTAPPYQHYCCLYDISRIFEGSWVLRFSQTATFKTIIKSVRL